MKETKNAVIEGAVIANDDHGLLSAWVTLDYGGGGQGFGGYVLYLPDDFKHATNQKNYAGHFIWRVMQIAGVSEWGELAGKTVRARGDHGHVDAIGHIVKDDWFDPAKDFELMKRAPVAESALDPVVGTQADRSTREVTS